MTHVALLLALLSAASHPEAVPSSTTPLSTGGTQLTDVSEYDTAGLLVASQPAGLTQPRAYEYGPDRRLVSEVLGPTLQQQQQQRTSYAYDARGLLVHIEAPAPTGLTWNTHRWYDARGQLTAEAVGDVSLAGALTDAQVTGFHYDDAGQLDQRLEGATGVTNGVVTGGSPVTFGFDVGPRGELRSATLPLPGPNNVWQYHYDALNRLQEVVPPTSPGAVTQTFQLDALGRQTHRTRGAAVWTTAWDDAVGVETSLLGNVRTVTMDGRGRPIHVVNSPGPSQTAPLTRKDYLYDGVDALVRLTETRSTGTVVSSFDYDSAHLLYQVHRTAEPDVTTTRALDGQPLSVAVGSDAVQYGYDDFNRVGSVTGAWGSTTVTWQKGGGRLATLSDASLSSAFCFNTRAQASAVLTATGVTVPDCSQGLGQSLLVGLKYAYDERGNRTSESRVGGVTATRDFAYDAANRLVGETRLDGHSVLYSLNPDGSRAAEKEYPFLVPAASLSSFGLLGATRHTGYLYDDAPPSGTRRRQGALAGAVDNLAAGTPVIATYVVDDEGRMTSMTRGGVTTTMTWDVEGRLIRSAVGDVYSDFEYDGFGLCRKAVTPSGTRTWLWAGANGEAPIGEAPAGSAMQLKAFVGGMTLAEGTTRFGVDALGSAVASRTGTASAQVYGFDAYGGYSSATGLAPAPDTSSASAGFTGHSYDADVGMTYAQQRWLESTTGTWLSMDPVFGDLKNPNSLGLWACAGGNPLRYTDPDGRQIVEVEEEEQSRRVGPTEQAAGGQVYRNPPTWVSPGGSMTRGEPTELQKEEWSYENLARATAANNPGRPTPPPPRLPGSVMPVVEGIRQTDTVVIMPVVLPRRAPASPPAAPPARSEVDPIPVVRASPPAAPPAQSEVDPIPVVRPPSSRINLLGQTAYRVTPVRRQHILEGTPNDPGMDRSEVSRKGPSPILGVTTKRSRRLRGSQAIRAPLGNNQPDQVGVRRLLPRADPTRMPPY